MAAILAIVGMVLLAGTLTDVIITRSPSAVPQYRTMFSGRLVSNNSSNQSSPCKGCFTVASQHVNLTEVRSPPNPFLTLFVSVDALGPAPACVLGGYEYCYYTFTLESPTNQGGLGPGQVLVYTTIYLVNNSWEGTLSSNPSDAEFSMALYDVAAPPPQFDAQLTVQIVTF